MLTSAALALVLAAAPASVEVTVYNQGFGLVKEVRSIDLRTGRQTVRVEDVAARIEADTVGFRNLTDPKSMSVLEQNYQFDLISPLAILNKSVGQRVSFRRALGSTVETIEGVLLSAPTSIVPDEDGDGRSVYNGLVIRTDSGQILLNPIGEIAVKEVPEGLISRPTLLWDLESTRAGASQVELSYLTQGIRWEASYVLTLLPGGAQGDVQGWVTINNQSGATYRDAKLKLLAGDVQRLQPRQRAELARDMAVKAAPAGAGGFQEESLFEYHLYTLQRPATIRDREIKQLSLLEGTNLGIQKKLILDVGMRGYMPQEGEIGVNNLNPQVRVEFQNTKENRMGMPLPQGKVRVYQRDQSGSVQMLGEDQINHTPRNELVSLVVGRSFDVVGNYRRTNFQRLGANGARESFEVEVRNRKEVPETVIVRDRLWGDWRVTAKNQDFVKRDATTIEFTVKLEPNEVRKVTYAVETRW